MCDPYGLPVVVKAGVLVEVAVVQRLTLRHPRLTLAHIGSRAWEGRDGQPLLTKQRLAGYELSCSLSLPACFPRSCKVRQRCVAVSVAAFFFLSKSVIKYAVPHIANEEQPGCSIGSLEWFIIPGATLVAALPADQGCAGSRMFASLPLAGIGAQRGATPAHGVCLC